MIPARNPHQSLRSLTLILAGICAVESARAQSTNNLREKVLNAWQSRQNRVGSAVFKIRCTLVITENERLRSYKRHKSLNGIDVRPKDTAQGDVILVESYEVVFDGDKLRFVRSVDKASEQLAKVVNRNSSDLYVTNGVDYRALLNYPDQNQNQGVISRAEEFMAFNSWEIAPIRQTFRALSQHYRRVVTNLEIVNGDHELNGRSAVVVQHVHNRDSLSATQYWTDPSREYVILRVQSTHDDGSVRSQQDIEYEEDKSGTWVPVKWVNTVLDSDGQVRRSDEYKVTSYEINPQLSADLFELVFAPGVEVFDKRKGTGSKANIWTVNSDGSKTMKRGVDPDNSVDVRRSRAVWLWINGAILLLLATYFVLRRRRLARDN